MPKKRNPDDINTVERNYKLRLLQMGVTQAQLADACGWQRQHLYYMLTHRNPSMRLLRRLAVSVGLSVSALVADDPADVMSCPAPADLHDHLTQVAERVRQVDSLTATVEP